MRLTGSEVSQEKGAPAMIGAITVEGHKLAGDDIQLARKLKDSEVVPGRARPNALKW